MTGLAVTVKKLDVKVGDPVEIEGAQIPRRLGQARRSRA
jgi:hypothetical protein